MTRRRSFVAVFLTGAALIWFAAAARSHSENRMPQDLDPSGYDKGETGFLPGQFAPGLQLRSIAGSTVTLSGLRGKPVVLNFWATWCAPCRLETPWLVQLYRRYGPEGLAIVGVSLDEAEKEPDVIQFVTERQVPYPILLGNASVAKAYGGARYLPQTFFIDRQGKIAKKALGVTSKKDLEHSIKLLLKKK